VTSWVPRRALAGLSGMVAILLGQRLRIADGRGKGIHKRRGLWHP
jgi:cadmium resistance protein CadD (predicted permease)